MSNPQEAIVSKFLKAKLAEFTKAIPDTASPEQRQTLQAAKDAILKEAIANMNATLDKAGIPKDFKEKIEESILSNGARSLAYQQLAEYAKENPNKIATKVLDVLKELDPTSVEWASIKNDTALLQTLKRHIIKAWLSGYDDWLPIVKLLGLKGDFAADTVDKTAKADKFAQERETSRLKVTSPAEKQKLAEQQAEMQKSATYWAQSIAFKHKKGIFLADALEVMTSVMEAQKNSNWDEVQAELKIINPKALAYVLEFMAKNNTPAKITPATLFEIIAKEDSIFAMNATNMAKFKKTISKMDSIDLLANCFNLKAVETQARAALDKKTQAQEAVTKATTPEEKTKAKAEVDKVNVEVSKTTMDMIKNLDIAPEFTKTLNKIFSPNLAFELKILIRDKVVAQLAGADQAAVKELLPSFSHEEVKLLVEFIRALSSNEKEDMSRTGTQYRGLTSKGQQRDVAAAVHSRELAKAQNVLNSQVYHQMKPKEKAALLKELNGSLQIAGEEKEAKFKSFEETKKKYDERVKKVVSFITGVALKLITAPLESFPFLGTVIEAAVTAIVESITDKILGGDRVGSWKTVLASGTKKFLISLAKGLISQAAPMLLSSVLGASGLLALESGGNRISEAINTIMNSNEKFAGIINTLKETADKVSNALDNNPIANFISNAKDQIAAFQKQIEDNFGLVGKVAVEVVNEQVDEVKAAMSEKVTAFRDKLLTKIDGQRGYLVQALNTVETIQGYYDTAKSAFEAIQSMAAKSRLEKFQAENPDLTGDDLTTAMKGMDDFKDLGDEDWENITSYADMSDKLKTTFDEFVSEQVSGIIDPQLDALMGQAEEDEEIEKLDDNSQLSDGAPKKSLINLRDALKQQGKAIPEFMDALIAKL